MQGSMQGIRRSTAHIYADIMLRWLRDVAVQNRLGGVHDALRLLLLLVGPRKMLRMLVLSGRYASQTLVNRIVSSVKVQTSHA